MRRFFLILALTLPLALPAGAASAAEKSPVEVFVTSWCPYCTKLESFLKKEGIDYTRYDVEQDAKGAEIFRSIGGSGIPVTRVGSQVVPGYDPEAVLAAIESQR
jgi:glutaredoxin